MNAGEREALITFFETTGGNSWNTRDGWCTNAPLGEWHGIVTNDQGSVVKLELRQNNLVGTICPEIRQFKNLQYFDLSHNQLSGPIPKELGLLIKLKSIYTRGNTLTGHIPKELGLLIELQELYLYNNELKGAIPKELGDLKDLQRLDLSNNQLSGLIPKELGLLNDLQVIRLHKNKLTGAIPKEFGELKGLEDLRVSNNQLSDFGGVDEAQKLLSMFKEEPRQHRIGLHGNPWIMPPESVVGKGLPAVISYYADVRMAIDAGAEVISRRLLKVVLVGSSSAGKTSLMKSIISGHADKTNGPPEEASTEGIELQPHTMENTSVEFYDCAGQVDYGGMHQVFLTQRALYLLVWDITRCYGVSGKDLTEEIRDMIMRWLYTVHLRAPGATVILVANKCDEAIDDVEETTKMVEKRVSIMLQDWKDRRDKNDLKEVKLLSGLIPVSCHDYTGIPDVIDRIKRQGATKIDVPPAWELALNVIDALRCRRSPMNTAREHLRLPVTTSNVSTEQSRPFISKKELSDLWQSIVEGVEDEVRGTVDRGAVCNTDSALEGAILIREFAGQILLVERGNGIFLDVVWLSDLLTPILSHKLKRKSFQETILCQLRDELVQGKILRWEFARHLWGDVLNHSDVQSSEGVGNYLYRVLIKLGVAIPLRELENGTSSQLGTPHSKMLIIMRLRETCSEGQHMLLESRINEALTAGVHKVTLKWDFDAAGCPYGLMERLIASCHVVGVVEYRLCWRYGALFRSRELTRRFGEDVRLYTMIIRYDITHDTPDEDVAHVLTVQMIGPLENPRVWTALRFVASATITLAKEWPGVILKGSPVCPRHPLISTAVYLTTPDEAYIGRPLIPERALDARSTGCDCHRGSKKVVALVIEKLGLVIDIEKDPFEGLPEHENRLRKGVCEMFIIWRPNARQTCACLWTFAVVLFGGILTGVVEEVNIIWYVCLPIMILSLLGAVFASVVHYKDLLHRASRDRVSQSVDLQP